MSNNPGSGSAIVSTEIPPNTFVRWVPEKYLTNSARNHNKSDVFRMTKGVNQPCVV